MQANAKVGIASPNAFAIEDAVEKVHFIVDFTTVPAAIAIIVAVANAETESVVVTVSIKAEVHQNQMPNFTANRANLPGAKTHALDAVTLDRAVDGAEKEALKDSLLVVNRLIDFLLANLTTFSELKLDVHLDDTNLPIEVEKLNLNGN